MKKHTFGILCLTVLAACACGKEFELEVTSDPKLFLQCCPGPGDTTIIQLNRTFAVGKTADNVLLLEDADIDFVVNGTPYYVERAVDTAGVIPPGCWFVVASLQAGDEVAIEARAEGFNPISARVTLPSPAPDFTWKFNRDSVRVTFRDDPATEDWYGLAVRAGGKGPEAESRPAERLFRQLVVFEGPQLCRHPVQRVVVRECLEHGPGLARYGFFGAGDDPVHAHAGHRFLCRELRAARPLQGAALPGLE